MSEEENYEVITSLMNRVKKLEERYIYKTVSKSMFEDLEGEIAELKIRESDTYKDVSELKNHDIFKIWKSVRKGGKTTLTAILNLNQGIEELKTKLDKWRNEANNMIKNVDNHASQGRTELKINFDALKCTCKSEYEELKERINSIPLAPDRSAHSRIDNQEEVLREFINLFENPIDEMDWSYWQAHIKRLLDKLNGGDSKFCAGDDCRTCDIDRKECPIVKEMNGGDKSVKTLVENGSGEAINRLRR
jgi:hypothetical protein